MLNDKRNNKNAGITKTIVFFTITTLVLISVLLVAYHLVGNNYSNVEDEVQTLETELNNTLNTLNVSGNMLTKLQAEAVQYQEYLYENNTKLQQLTTGDELQLRNPTYNDAIEFVNNDSSTDEKSMIENAKTQGIRCSYVQIVLADRTYYPLIGFDTIDKGMVYFESFTDYRVFPVIGESYEDCVQDSPYYSSLGDTIEDILVFW